MFNFKESYKVLCFTLLFPSMEVEISKAVFVGFKIDRWTSI